MRLELDNYPVWASLSFADLQRWLIDVAEKNDREIRQLAYRFVDDSKIVEMNNNFLGHDYPTDIITFQYSSGYRLDGEIFISLDTVDRNSRDLGVDIRDELDRVIVHGLLHMIGFGDKDIEQKRKMRAAEDKSLILRPKNRS